MRRNPVNEADPKGHPLQAYNWEAYESRSRGRSDMKIPMPINNISTEPGAGGLR